jgi:hypothetical protein
MAASLGKHFNDGIAFSINWAKANLWRSRKRVRLGDGLQMVKGLGINLLDRH